MGLRMQLTFGRRVDWAGSHGKLIGVKLIQSHE